MAIMWRQAALVGLMVGIVAPSQAQPRRHDGIIEGRVVDRQTQRPVTSAAILVESTSLSALVDADGRFKLEQVPAGVRALRVEADGYAPLLYHEVQVSPGRATTVVLELVPLARDQRLREDVTVTGTMAAQPPASRPRATASPTRKCAAPPARSATSAASSKASPASPASATRATTSSSAAAARTRT